MQQSNPLSRHIRTLYQKGPAYVFAKRPEEIAKSYGFERIAMLASNENPFGPSETAVREAGELLTSMHRYPDSTNATLITALKEYHGAYEFVTGVGMDGVIETCLRVLIDPGDTVVIATPTFSFYGLAAAAQGSVIKNVPRKEDFSVDNKAFIAASKGAKLSFLCTPNNPSGTMTPLSDIEEILSNIDGLLFLDNAYAEFGETDYRVLMNEYDNLIVGRTMSKVFGLAGCRIGYAIVPEWLKPAYEKAATPFALNTISAAAAAGALRDKNFVDNTIRHVRRWREQFVASSGKVLPSGANFVMIDVSPLTGDEATDICAKHGVLVRSCRSFPGLADHYIRVCVGEDWENERFLEVLKKL